MQFTKLLRTSKLHDRFNWNFKIYIFEIMILQMKYKTKFWKIGLYTFKSDYFQRTSPYTLKYIELPSYVSLDHFLLGTYCGIFVSFFFKVGLSCFLKKKKKNFSGNINISNEGYIVCSCSYKCRTKIISMKVYLSL